MSDRFDVETGNNDVMIGTEEAMGSDGSSETKCSQ